MDTTPKYGITMLVTPPAACPLQAELQATATRLQALAAATGLGDFSFAVRRQCSDGGTRWFEWYDLSAKDVAQEWTARCVLGSGNTLADAETAFLTSLRDYEQAAYDADPTRRGEQMSEMYQELAAYDYAA